MHWGHEKLSLAFFIIKVMCKHLIIFYRICRNRSNKVEGTENSKMNLFPLSHETGVWMASIIFYLVIFTQNQKIGYLYYHLFLMTIYLISVSFIQTLDYPLPTYLFFSLIPYIRFFKSHNLFENIVLIFFAFSLVISVLLNGIFQPVSIFLIRYGGIFCSFFIFLNVECTQEPSPSPRFFVIAVLCEGIITIIGIILSGEARLMLNYQCTVGCISTSLIILCVYAIHMYGQSGNKRRASLVIICTAFFAVIACRSGTRGYIIVCLSVVFVSFFFFTSLRFKTVVCFFSPAIVLMQWERIEYFFIKVLRMGESTGIRHLENTFVIRFFLRCPLHIKVFGNGFGTPVTSQPITSQILSFMIPFRALDTYTYSALSRFRAGHNCWFTVMK